MEADNQPDSKPKASKQPTKASKRPIFFILSQAWKDYKRGRDLRRQEQNSEQVSRPAKLSNANRNQGSAAQIISLEQELKHPQPPVSRISDQAQCQREGWKNTGGEYPWRIERSIPGDGNWRGTWILEVKDMFAMEWETVRVYDGRRWRWESLPHVHWPFPYKQSSHAGKEMQNIEAILEKKANN